MSSLSIFEPQGATVGGTATTTASSAAAFPASSSYGAFIRVANFGADAFRLSIGGASVSATASDWLINPGVEYIKTNIKGKYFSVMSLTGSCAFSITSGTVV
jgi:hypothetical protein